MGWQKFWRKARFVKSVRTSSGITVDAGGITVTAGNIAVAAGGVDLPVSVSTAATTLVNYGLSVVGSSNSTASVTFDMAAPTVGVPKHIEFDSGSSDAAYILRASTGGAVTFNGTDHICTITTAGDGFQGLHLIGATATRWSIQGLYGTLTFSTS